MDLKWLVVFSIACVNTVVTMDCHEGFNVTILGVPFFHWGQNECNGDSVCFSQEIETRFPHPGIEVKARYGGCVATSYSDPLSCKKLFGEESDVDPATVFNMLPGLDPIIESVEREFRHNLTEAYRILFSNGTGTESFINGCLKLMNNLGIKTEKAETLKYDLVKLINVTLPRPMYLVDGVTWTTGIPQADIDEAFGNFLTALRRVVDAYKIDYPVSEFPELAWRIAQYVNTSYNLPTSTTGCYFGHYALNFDFDEIDACVTSRKEAATKVQNMVIDILVDAQFAVFNELDFITDMNLFEEILKAFPEYEFYLRLLRLLDRHDIKDIYKIFPKYLMIMNDGEGKGYFDMFVTAFNVTIAKITSKFGEFNKELRQRFAPKACKFYTCQSNYCNTQEMLTSMKEITFPEFNSDTPTSGKENEAGKSPRLELNVVSGLSDGNKPGGITQQPGATTTSSATATQATNLLTAVTILVFRTLV